LTLLDSMMTVAECTALMGAGAHEIPQGTAPSAKHHHLLSGYLLTLGRGPAATRDLIIADLLRFLDLGARHRAADLLIVLLLFCSRFPETARVSPPS
jgi:hypothetical protein